jgi:hypothetical protein
MFVMTAVLKIGETLLGIQISYIWTLVNNETLQNIQYKL